MSKTKKRIMAVISIIMVLCIVGGFIPLILKVYASSFDYIETLKTEYSTGSTFRILEIAPTEDTGTIGYYIDGQEPIANFEQSISGFSSQLVRESYAEKLFAALEAKGIISNGNTTPLTKTGQYSESYPWVSKSGKELNLSSREVSKTTGTMTEADGGEYTDIYDYRLADTSFINEFNHTDFIDSIRSDLYVGTQYDVDTVLATSDTNETILVFGATQANYNRNLNDYGYTDFHDLNKLYGREVDYKSELKTGYYGIAVEPGATYALNFQVDIPAGEKAKVTVIPYTEEGKPVGYSPNYSKSYWYLNEYVTEGEYSYTFGTNANENVKYIQVRFDVENENTFAVFSGISLNKYNKTYFEFGKWASLADNRVFKGDGTTTDKTNYANNIYSITTKNSTSTETTAAPDENLYAMSCEPETTYILTYHVESSLGDTALSTIKVYGYGKTFTELVDNVNVSELCNNLNTETNSSGTYSVAFTTAPETYNLGICFGIKASKGKVANHTSAFSNVSVVKYNDFSTKETATHVQNIDHFTYGNAGAELGDNIFSFEDWAISNSSSASIASRGEITTDLTSRSSTVICYKGQKDIYSKYTTGEYNSSYYYMKVTPGMKYQLRYYVNNNRPENTVQMYAFGYDVNKKYVTCLGSVIDNGAGYIEKDLTMPSNVEYVQIRIGGRWYSDSDWKKLSDDSKLEQTVVFSNITFKPYNKQAYYYDVDFTPMSDYVLEGTVEGVGFKIRNNKEYYRKDLAGNYEKVEVANMKYGDRIYTKEDGYYINQGSIGINNFHKNSATTYYKKVDDSFVIINKWETLSYGTDVYSYYMNKGVYEKVNEGKANEHYEYLGSISRTFLLAGTYGEDEFAPKKDVQYYSYDSTTDTYPEVAIEDMTPGMNVFYQDVSLDAVSSDIRLESSKTYYFASVSRTNKTPVTRNYDNIDDANGLHTYYCAVDDFRVAEDGETAYFVQNEIIYYLYVGAGKGEYNFTATSNPDDEVPVATEVVFYSGGYKNNEWFLKYVFDYPVKADGTVDTTKKEKMSFSVETVSPSYFESITSEDVEAFVSGFNLIVFTAGSNLTYNAKFDEDFSKETYDILYAYTQANDFSIPTIVDTSLASINYADRYGDVITNIPKLINALTNNETGGGVEETIYRFNQNEITHSSNYNLASKFFNEKLSSIYYTSDSDGYYPIISDIKLENKYRTEIETPLEERVSEATAIRYILNYYGRRVENTKDKVKILEIQPYSNYSQLTTDTTKASSTVECVLNWFPAGEFKANQFYIKTVAVAEFNGMNEDLVETYDMIYLGSSLKNMNTRLFGSDSSDDRYERDNSGNIIYNTDGSAKESSEIGKTIPNYNDFAMDGMYYTNIGDKYGIINATYNSGHRNTEVLGGLLYKDYNFANLTKRMWELRADNELSHTDADKYTRANGNDITENKAAEIEAFADAGHPVVVSSVLCDNDWTGNLSVKLTTKYFLSDGKYYAWIVASYDGDALPTGVQPIFSWTVGGVAIKETDSIYKSHVINTDLDGDGLNESYYIIEVNNENPYDASYTTYRAEISSFKFTKGKYQSLINFTRPKSNEITFRSNPRTYTIAVGRGADYAFATVTVTGAKLPAYNGGAATVVTTSDNIISLGDAEGNIIAYEWRGKSLTGDWDSHYISATSFSSDGNKYAMFIQFSDLPWYEYGSRKYIDLKFDIFSNTIAPVHFFNDEDSMFCEKLKEGESLSRSVTVSSPSFVQTKNGIAGASGVGKFALRAARVDNCTNLYSTINKISTYRNVSSDAAYEGSGNSVANAKTKLLVCTNFSSPKISCAVSEGQTGYFNEDDVFDMGGGDLEFKFKITNLTDSTPRSSTYSYKFYFDLDGDAKFTEDEQVSSEFVSITETTASDRLVKDDLKNSYEGVDHIYKLYVLLSGDYVGILPWKLKIISNKTNKVHTSFSGYCYKEPVSPVEIKVLQVLPMTCEADSGLTKTTYNVASWNTTTMSYASNASLFLQDCFGNLGNMAKRTIVDENGDGKLDYIKFEINKHTGSDGTAKADYTLKIYITSLYQLTGQTGSKLNVNMGLSRKDMLSYFKAYDMLILGFGDVYANGTTEEFAQAVSDYIDLGYSVLYTHDATSYHNNFYPAERQGAGYYLNLYVRDKVGMDKYGITYKILGLSNLSRSAAGVGESSSPDLYGYTNNIYTAAQVIRYYDTTPKQYTYYDSALKKEKVGKDASGNEINGSNKHPVNVYLGIDKKWHIKGSNIKPEWTADNEEPRLEAKLGYGVYAYCIGGVWYIGEDQNGNVILYDEKANVNEITGWQVGHDKSGEAITSDNYLYGIAEYKTNKWVPVMNGDTPATEVNSTKTKTATKVYNAYVYYDQNDSTWKVGCDKSGNVITYFNDSTVSMREQNINAMLEAGYQVSYAPGSNKKSTDTLVQGYTTYVMNRFESDAHKSQLGPTKYFTDNQHSTTTMTSTVSQVNKGQITMYPFNLNTKDFTTSTSESTLKNSSTVSVMNTHEQYYTLDLTSSQLENGEFNDDYATVWYCLAGDGYSNNVYNDCSNSYYIYRYKNVTYTGMGHTNSATIDEAKLFINTIVAAHVKTNYSGNISLYDQEGEVITNYVAQYSEKEQDNGTVKVTSDVKEINKNITIKLTNIQEDSKVQVYYVDASGNKVIVDEIPVTFIFNDDGSPKTTYIYDYKIAEKAFEYLAEIDGCELKLNFQIINSTKSSAVKSFNIIKMGLKKIV